MSDEYESLNEPPSVEIDEHGIGAWLGGVREYYILWSDIRTIDIDVVGYGDSGAEAFWVIEGTSGAPPFFAPVDLVVGGDKLTAKLCSMPGFDESAFEQARGAEERGEAGRFTSWRS